MKIDEGDKASTIQGDLITDIQSFYQQINSLFMQQEVWRIANSLDALDDLLSGSYGILKLHTKIDLIWKNYQCFANALGSELTKKYYLKKLEPGSPFNKKILDSNSLSLTLAADLLILIRLLKSFGPMKIFSFF
ncbi:barstar family protein [Pedobacter agri]|uniref:barstar family protein n=1 Tax=Pedobacter agri TaxID=454586 RepID=UPI0029307D52|nr:barstar family protein [Pedobacter agri]